MKKRLSDRITTVVPMAICFMLLCTIAIYSFRAITTGSPSGYVQGEIPLVRIPLKDSMTPPKRLVSNERIDSKTPVVVLTTEAFYFGDSAAFATDITNVRNKFQIKHIDGQPQIVTLVKTMKEWDDTHSKSDIKTHLIFSPTSEIPMPIVIKVMAAIQDLSPYKKIVLSGGVI